MLQVSLALARYKPTMLFAPQRSLADQALVVLSIELVLPAEPDRATPPVIAPLDGHEHVQQNYEARIEEVLRQPGELIKLLEALAAEPASAGLTRQLNYLLEHLRRGVTAQQFLSNARLCIWLPIVMSSEQSAAMGSRYTQLLTQVKDEKNRRRSLISTFSYPALLMAFALMLLLPICIFIVPGFQKMFLEFGLSLPTQRNFCLISQTSSIIAHTICCSGWRCWPLWLAPAFTPGSLRRSPRAGWGGP